MAGSVNKVLIVGHLGKDPELKYTPGGAAVCNFSVATSERWKDKSDQVQEKTEWHRIVVWNALAENCEKYLKKGRQVYLEGKLQTRSWDDKDGQKRYATEIVAHHVVFLGGGQGQGERGEQEERHGADRGGSRPAQRPQRHEDTGYGGEDFGAGGGDDDIPF